MSKLHLFPGAVLFVLGAALPLLALAELPGARSPEAATPNQTPLCVVSGERLVPGQIVEYVCRREGQPDRVLRFCCHRCVARFKAEPDRYLKKLDQSRGSPRADAADVSSNALVGK